MDDLLRKDGLPDRRFKRKTERTCPICGVKFIPRGEHQGRVQKYCSKQCWQIRGDHRRKQCIGCGRVGIGLRCQKYCSRECAFKHKVGENANAWQGDNAGYSALHKFIEARHGKPKLCVECGTKGKRMNWANLSRKYLRDRSDWAELCAKCHKWFDTRPEHERKQMIARWEKYSGKKAILAD